MPDSALNVIQVKYAERVTQKSLVLHDYDQYGQPDGDLDMEYNFWVIRAPDARSCWTPATTSRPGTGWARSA